MDLLFLAFFGFVAALTPGPDIMYVIRVGICYGKKEALEAVFGILTGNLIYLFLVFIGLGFLGKSLIFQSIVGIFGGIYLLRIAKIVYNEKVEIIKSCEIKNFYKEALIINLSNPKAMIFFAVVITPFLNNGFYSFFALFIGIAFAFTLAALISSKIETKKIEIINKIAAILFLIFAFKLFLISYNAILNMATATSNSIIF